MKNLIIALACLVAFSSCGPNQNYNNGGRVYVNSQPNVVVTPEASNLGDNLDLQALGELVKSSNTAQEIESKLNTSGSINNLDLDGDGNVDYIKVTEYGDGSTRGFSFTVDLADGSKQEVATVDLQKGANDVAMNIQGNQQVYGSGAYYQSHFTMSDLLIWHYLFTPHPYYYSPYRYGYYPSYYHSYRSAPISAYRSRVTTTTKTTKFTRTTTRPKNNIKSPNSSYSSKTVNKRAESLANPKSSQKSFSKTSSEKSRPNTNGFSNKNSYIGSSSSSSRKSSSSGFFGSSRKSSSSSSYSSGSSRRSSSGFGSSSRGGRRR